MESDLLNWVEHALQWGVAGIVLVVVHFFLQYIKHRDKDLTDLLKTTDKRHAEKDDLFVQSLRERDKTMKQTIDEQTQVIRKLDETIIRLDTKISNNANH